MSETLRMKIWELYTMRLEELPSDLKASITEKFLEIVLLDKKVDADSLESCKRFWEQIQTAAETRRRAKQ